MPVRLGMPRHVTGLSDVVTNPIHATGVGLLLVGSKSQGRYREESKEGGMGSAWDRMKAWFQGNF